MREVKKVLKTVTYGDVIFDNFPVYIYDKDPTEYLVMRDEQIAQQVIAALPDKFKQAVRVDCSKISEFNSEPEDIEATEVELRVASWLRHVVQDEIDNG